MSVVVTYMGSKATIKNLFDSRQKIKHIYDKKPKFLDKTTNYLVILFVLEQMFEERQVMTAQIIEFPMHRVRQPQARRVLQHQQLQVEVRPSIRIARKVILYVVIAISLWFLFLAQNSSSQSAEATGSKMGETAVENFTYITVQSGDTLWALAEKYASNSDPRDFIQAVMTMNGMTDTVVNAGMRLAIPRG